MKSILSVNKTYATYNKASIRNPRNVNTLRSRTLYVSKEIDESTIRDLNTYPLKTYTPRVTIRNTNIRRILDITLLWIKLYENL